MRLVVEQFSKREERTVELPDRATGLDLYRLLSLAPDAHLLVRGDAPLPLDEPLEEGEALTILSVVSGGVGSEPNY